MALLVPTPAGIYCPEGDLYIDPHQRVSRAVITHAHADHAQRGCGSYLCSPETKPLLQVRLGRQAVIETLPWNTPLFINGVKLTLHPSGHIRGAAQVRLEKKGEVWLVSGDYKHDPDPTCEAWEPVRAHVFLSECTFGLPIFRWPPATSVLAQIAHWWQDCQNRGVNAVLYAYSLGKAQRLLASLPELGPRYVHPAIAKINQVYQAQGLSLGKWLPWSDRPLAGALVVVPKTAKPDWLLPFSPYEEGEVSGWFLLPKRRQPNRQPFLLSDHVDFYQLANAVRQIGAERVYFYHGYAEVMQAYFAQLGYASYIWGDAQKAGLAFEPNR